MDFSEELTKAFEGDVFVGLDRFFSIASRYGVESVSLNCKTHSVNVDFYHTDTDIEDCPPEEYYMSIYNKINVGNRPKATLGHWKKLQMKAPTREKYQQFVGQQLATLLMSDFLVLEDWMPTGEEQLPAEELRIFGLSDKGLDNDYCFLRQMMNCANGFLSVDKDACGRYLSSRRDKLTENGLRCFINFVQLCELIDMEIAHLTAPDDILSDADEALLGRLLGYARRGDWQKPATSESLCHFVSALFGADTKRLDADDKDKPRQFRDFFKGGRGGANTDRVEVSMANLVGYLMRHQLIAGGQKKISKDIFGNEQQVNNINKGRDNNASTDFIALEPLLDKYRKKIIGE